MTPLQKYQQDLTRHDFHYDAAQEFAVACLAFLQNPPSAPLPECESAADSRLVIGLTDVLRRVIGADA